VTKPLPTKQLIGSDWFIEHDGQRSGPYTAQECHDRYAELMRERLVTKQQRQTWRRK
jgi:hypothetical protein